jgi:hypothetical protein
MGKVASRVPPCDMTQRLFVYVAVAATHVETLGCSVEKPVEHAAAGVEYTEEFVALTR